mmetsp:Transcript_29546/g.96226  ORF Transcript_29546/g.96226 Transcript_29546/m.96226 type:complete len:219 (-) Transcript_29546:84-740(-)
MTGRLSKNAPTQSARRLSEQSRRPAAFRRFNAWFTKGCSAPRTIRRALCRREARRQLCVSSPAMSQSRFTGGRPTTTTTTETETIQNATTAASRSSSIPSSTTRMSGTTRNWRAKLSRWRSDTSASTTALRQVGRKPAGSGDTGCVCAKVVPRRLATAWRWSCLRTATTTNPASATTSSTKKTTTAATSGIPPVRTTTEPLRRRPCSSCSAGRSPCKD